MKKHQPKSTANEASKCRICGSANLVTAEFASHFQRPNRASILKLLAKKKGHA